MALPESIRERIEALRADTRSGAVTLTQKAVALLDEIASEPFLAEAAAAVAQAQAAMAPLRNLAQAVIDRGMSPREFLARMGNNTARVIALAAELIPDGATVLTHSASHTVSEALRKARRGGRSFSVIATESRPVCEGAEQARKLAADGIPVALVVDAAMGRILTEASLVLVGADSVCAGGVVNKIGTTLLALGAKELGKEIYTLCSSEKVCPTGEYPPPEASRDPDEVARDRPPGLSVNNLYFEITSLDLFTAIVTETGTLTPLAFRARYLARR